MDTVLQNGKKNGKKNKTRRDKNIPHGEKQIKNLRIAQSLS